MSFRVVRSSDDIAFASGNVDFHLVKRRALRKDLYGQRALRQGDRSEGVMLGASQTECLIEESHDIGPA